MKEISCVKIKDRTWAFFLARIIVFMTFERHYDIKISKIQLKLNLGPHDSSYLAWYYYRTTHDFKSHDDIIEEWLYQNHDAHNL